MKITRNHRWIPYLALGLFLWSTIPHSVAMDDTFQTSSLHKPRNMGALDWLKSLEVKRSQAEKRPQTRDCEDLTREISATLSGKYGIEDRPATNEERLIMLDSVMKTRRLFKDKREIIDDFYFGYDKEECWQKVGRDQLFTVHMGVIAATDYLSFDYFKGGNRFHIGEPSKFGERSSQKLGSIISETIPKVQTVHREPQYESMLRSLHHSDWTTLVRCLDACLPSSDTLLAVARKMKTAHDKENPYVLKTIRGASLSFMQNIGAEMSYVCIPQTLGNILNIVDGELTVTRLNLENEEKIMALYQKLGENVHCGITVKTQFTTESEIIRNGASRCVGGTGMSLTASQSFSGNHTLYGSQGNIEFSSPVFDFSSCFIDVNVDNTIFTITPPDTLNSPIEFLRITPKKTPLFLQGKIDFRALLFEDFVVSNSDIRIKFKKQE